MALPGTGGDGTLHAMDPRLSPGPPGSPPQGVPPGGYQGYPGAPPAAPPGDGQPLGQAGRRGGPFGAAGRPRDDRLVGGIILVGLGAFLLVAQLVPDVGRLVTLLVGLFLLGLFVLRRHYGLLVAGCIVSGVGVGVALQGSMSDEQSGGVVVLCLGLGFLAIYGVGALLRMSENHWWPLVPGGILVVIGAILLSGQDVGDAFRWWPIGLVVIGIGVIAQALARARR